MEYSYVKKQSEDSEAYDIKQVETENLNTWLENGWEVATQEEYDAQIAGSEESEGMIAEESVVEEVLESVVAE